MAKRKTTVLEELQRVRLIGPSLAETLYTEHGLRSVDDLVKFGEDGHLDQLSGVGQKKSATILKSAKRIASANGKDKDQAATPDSKVAPQAKSKTKTKTKTKSKTKSQKKAAPSQAKTPASRANGRAAQEVSRPEPATRQPAASAAAGGATATGRTSPTPRQTTSTPAKSPARSAASNAKALQARFIDTLRCPACGNDSFDHNGTNLTCQACQRQFSLQNGIADLAPPSSPSRSVTQKLMESRFYAQFYEEFMRPRLTGVVSDRSMREEYRLSADFLDFGDNTRLLDVGCGTANFTRYFAQRIGLAETPLTQNNLPLVVGMDLSWPMLENARRNIRQENLDGKVFLLRGDATRIPARRGAFNRLHCAGTLHLTDDIDESLRNFARVLEPDGVCVIGTFILGSGAMRRLVKRLAEFPTRFHWFSRDELHKRLERAGFEILDDSVAGDAITVKARRI